MKTTPQVYTTLKRIREAEACKERYEFGRRALPDGWGDDQPIDICDIADHNGLDDALWIPYTALTGEHLDKRYRLFAVACCQNIWHLLNDQRSKDAVIAAHLFAHDEISIDDLDAARESAWESAWESARESAWVSAWVSARESAWVSARESAWLSARVSARESAWLSAWESAWESAWLSAWGWQTKVFKTIFSADFED